MGGSAARLRAALVVGGWCAAMAAGAGAPGGAAVDPLVPVEARVDADGRLLRDACRPEREVGWRHPRHGASGALHSGALAHSLPDPLPPSPTTHPTPPHPTQPVPPATTSARRALTRRAGAATSQASLLCRLEHGGSGAHADADACGGLFERYKECQRRLGAAVVADRRRRKASLFDG